VSLPPLRVIRRDSNRVIPWKVNPHRSSWISLELKDWRRQVVPRKTVVIRFIKGVEQMIHSDLMVKAMSPTDALTMSDSESHLSKSFFPRAGETSDHSRR